jgi:hypothetical protein
MNLFTQNSDLKKSGIFGWTLPAHWATLSNGERFNTCKNAGICGAFCYAKTGTFQFINVKKAHVEKLELVLNNRELWLEMIGEELKKSKYSGKFIRVHDAGDFFSEDYLLDWLWIAKNNPQCTFYAYTKEVSMIKRNQEAKLVPENFIFIFSFGGKEDHLIDKNSDRHSDVFTDYEKMIADGYVDICEDDKQAAINPNHRIGLFRNNIPHLIKKMNGKTFSEWSKSK